MASAFAVRMNCQMTALNPMTEATSPARLIQSPAVIFTRSSSVKLGERKRYICLGPASLAEGGLAVTLAVVFRRRVANRYELVFGSDSRLTGGQVNDQAQKIFQLPRNDALFVFAGDTQYAYPLLMQLLRSIESFPPSAKGRLRLSKAKGHILRVFQQSYASIHSLPVGQKYPEDPDNYFLLGGYDWVSSAFRTWLLRFDADHHRFVFHSVTRRNSFYFIGDDEEARVHAIVQTNRLLRHRKKTVSDINYEPLEVLGEIIRDSSFPAIGGAPQIGKVYQYLQTQLFQVKWTQNDSTQAVCHIVGRPLLPTERCFWPIFDPDRGFYVPRRTYGLETEPYDPELSG
jgi:hypothetical protein